MLDLAILGLLEERDLHGYEIRRQLRDRLGLLANVSFGSVYPALARLEKAGAVVVANLEATGTTPTSSSTIVVDSPIPPTGSLTGERAVFRARRHAPARTRRAKKAYRITDTGRRMFAGLLADTSPSDDARSFELRLAFARHLAPQSRLAFLERRRAQLLERRDEVRTAGGGIELDVYARSVVEHTAEGVEQDIRWIEQMIERERAVTAGLATPSTPSTTSTPSEPSESASTLS